VVHGGECDDHGLDSILVFGSFAIGSTNLGTEILFSAC